MKRAFLLGLFAGGGLLLNTQYHFVQKAQSQFSHHPTSAGVLSTPATTTPAATTTGTNPTATTEAATVAPGSAAALIASASNSAAASSGNSSAAATSSETTWSQGVNKWIGGLSAALTGINGIIASSSQLQGAYSPQSAAAKQMHTYTAALESCTTDYRRLVAAPPTARTQAASLLFLQACGFEEQGGKLIDQGLQGRSQTQLNAGLSATNKARAQMAQALAKMSS